MPDVTHEGGDPIGAPTTHRGPLENCGAPECLERARGWKDGDPLMEAIAAAVYELCETGDGSGLVVDDPRNIAAAAAQAAVKILGRDRCTCRQSAHARHHTDGPVASCPWCMTRDHADPTPQPSPGTDTVQTGGLL